MLHENTALLLINSTGEWLHRRGYRTDTGEAPLKENIAAGLVLDSGRRFSQPLYDICCGSGTICIEEIKADAKAKEIHKTHTISWSDLDPEIIVKAKANAKNAGLADDAIVFEVKDCKKYDLATLSTQPCTLISNPPYGQRMQQSDIADIHKHLFSLFEAAESKLSGGIFTGNKLIQPTNPRLREEKKLKNGAEEVVFWKRKK